MRLFLSIFLFCNFVFATEAEDIVAKKESIKTYINSNDSAKALKSLQIIFSAMISNAGSLENLTTIETALKAQIVTP